MKKGIWLLVIICVFVIVGYFMSQNQPRDVIAIAEKLQGQQLDIGVHYIEGNKVTSGGEVLVGRIYSSEEKVFEAYIFPLWIGKGHNFEGYLYTRAEIFPSDGTVSVESSFPIDKRPGPDGQLIGDGKSQTDICIEPTGHEYLYKASYNMD